MSHPVIFQAPYQFPSYGEHQILQYSTAYFNPYEVKHRKRTSRAQLQVLEQTFQQSHKPSSAVKRQLSTQLDMPLRNVQVWFQNRRAKDKHLANRAKAKAKTGDGSGNGDSSETPDSGAASVGDDEQEIHRSHNNQSSFTTPETSPTDETTHLTPPANIALRRGSAPAPLGLQHYQHQEQSQSPTNHRPNQPPRQFLAPPDPPYNGDQSALLGRRRSLPVFHPQHQQHRNSILPPGAPSLPTITDYSNSEDAQSSTLSPPHRPDESNSSPPTGHRPPFPHPSGGIPTNYRSCSTPGTSVFRVPDPSQWPVRLPKEETNGPLSIGIPHPSHAAPFSFPPVRAPSIPSSGPLPRADFSFGVQEENGEPEPGVLHESPRPNTAEDEEADARVMGLTSARFGSFASVASSNYSVDTDVTGITATTGTSDQSFHVAAAAAAAAMTNAGVRSRMSMGLGQGFPETSHYNGSSLSYGHELTAGPPGISRFPPGFDPDLRRASCPAQFVDMFSSLGVDPPSAGSSNSAGSAGSFQNQQQQMFPLASSLKKSPSHAVLSKSPLGMRIHVPNANQYGSHAYGGDEKSGHFREPLTAVVSDFQQPLLSTPLGSLEEGAEGLSNDNPSPVYPTSSPSAPLSAVSSRHSDYQHRGFNPSSGHDVEGSMHYNTVGTSKSFSAEMYQHPYFPNDGNQQPQSGYEVVGGPSNGSAPTASYNYREYGASGTFGMGETPANNSYENLNTYQVNSHGAHQLHQPAPYPTYHRGSVDMSASSLAGALESSASQPRIHAQHW